MPVRGLMAPNVVLRVRARLHDARGGGAHAVEEVARGRRRGAALTLLPVHRFPLERIADAHDAVEAGAVGKVLIDVG